MSFRSHLIAALPTSVKSVNVSYFVPVNVHNACNPYRFVAELAQMRLLHVLRRELGGVYNVSADFCHFSMSSFGIVSIAFQCSEMNAQELISTTVAELESLSLKGPNPQEVATIYEQYVVRQQRALQNNSYWLFWILDTYKQLLLLQAEDAPPMNAIDWVQKRVLQRSDIDSSKNIETQPYNVSVRLAPKAEEKPK